MNQLPFFSIIVVAFNASDSIEKTMQSILAQSFTDFEVIVKDGQSFDDTVNKIPKDPRIIVHVSRDDGIYDAMNQALANTKGRFINFLNCGDCFSCPTTLRSVYEEAKNHAEPCVIYGNLLFQEGVSVQVQKLTEFSLFRRPLNHQTCFADCRLFHKIGCFDLRFRILADYEFTLRTWFAGIPYFYIDKLLISYLGAGFSVAKNNLQRKEYELRKLRLKYFSGPKRLLYEIAMMFSLRSIRLSINSPSCPFFIRKAYRLFVSFLIGQINKW